MRERLAGWASLPAIFSRGGVINRQELHDAHGAVEESERLKRLPRRTGEFLHGHDKVAEHASVLPRPRFKEWHMDKGKTEKLATQRGFFDELNNIKAAGLIGSGLKNTLGRLPGLGKAMGHALAEPALDVAGLGMLAVPTTHKMMTAKDPSERRMSGLELGGLGVLGAHPTFEIGKHLLARH
jgi:hypothetical protein